MFVNGRWHLRRSDGQPNIVLDFGAPGDLPVVGDWNGDGVDTVGVFRQGTWHIRNSNTGGVAEASFFFGNPGDSPIAGDWSGTGADRPGLYRRSNGRVYIRNSLTSGFADNEFWFGVSGDMPVVGDFDGNGRDTVSIFRPSQRRFYIINQLGGPNAAPVAEYSYAYGISGDLPLVGDWNGDNVDSPGVFRSGTFYLRNSNSSGVADVVYQ
jgi:hypothetical protein